MLQVFTVEDRRKLVDLLSLSIDELETNSLLYRLLVALESRDTRLGTTIAQEVRGFITSASTLKDEIFSEMLDGAQYLQSAESYNEVAVTWKTDGSALKAKQDRLDQYLFDIQQRIGYTRRPTGNRLRTEWPNGRVQGRAYGRSLNNFF